MNNLPAGIAIPATVAAAGVVLVVVWTMAGPVEQLQFRKPGMDDVPAPGPADVPQRPVPGEPTQSDGIPSAISGAWPWFRGENRDAICDDGAALARHWGRNGPERLWSVELGLGFAAAAVSTGRVYVLDYDQQAAADTMRCLSLDDGREIWRNSYPVVIPRHHGMSRTIPAVIGKYVISLGPKCHVACWDVETGKCHWLLDLVLDYGATVPPWYTGQCPLLDVESDRLILAPAGRALLIAVDYKSGKVIWESPNPRGWTMTHVSIVPMEFQGRRMYVYCGKGGVAGVAAEGGSLLWDTTDWRIGMATCPSPVVVGEGKIFFCGGYNAGSLMLQIRKKGDRFVAETLFRLNAKRFGSEQQTPVLFDGHLYGVRQRDRQLVCLDLGGKELWNSGKEKFGAGPYMIADGLIYVLDDVGVLTIAEATPTAYKPLARAEVIHNGHDSWGPMALVAGRLIVRDMTRMVCLDVAEK